MRASIRRDHLYTPFLLVYGRNLRSYEGEERVEWEIDDQQLEMKVDERIKRIVELNESIIPQAHKNIDIYRKKMIQQNNKKTKKRKYYKNDLVMVSNHALEEQNAMLMSRWLGPFKIKEVLDNNKYIIQDGNMQLCFRITRYSFKL